MSSYVFKKPDFLKDYATVASRLEAFHAKYPEGRIVTELMPREDGLISFKAYVFTTLDAAEPSATGHSIDTLDLQKSSFEKLETASVGRALAFLGFCAKNISSVEEMERHESRQTQPYRPQAPAQPAPQSDAVSREEFMSDLVTPKQIGAIRSISNGKRLNADIMAQEIFGKTADELTKAQASEFIKKLQEA